MKRITALFTAIVMAIMTLSISVTADTFGSAPSSEIWDGSVDTSWYTGDKEVYDIGTASELAGLSELVNNGHCMQGIVINLTNKICNGNANTICFFLVGITDFLAFKQKKQSITER